MKGALWAMVMTGCAWGCTCESGGEMQPGMVRYETGSDRQSIVRVETEANSPRCSAIWIESTEIRAAGDPYRFHLERMRLRPRRAAGCASPGAFVHRDKTYRFVFDADSTSIREIGPLRRPAADPGSGDNRNLWTAIVEPDRKRGRGTPGLDSAQPLHRTAWVLARRRVRGYSVGRIEDAGKNQKLVPLKKSREVAAGEAGQIEAVGDRSVIVRFYRGSRAEALGHKRDALRRWYASLGGPYAEMKDDLYTAIRAEILEVSIEDIVELNDYLDQHNADRT